MKGQCKWKKKNKPIREGRKNPEIKIKTPSFRVDEEYYISCDKA